MKILQLVLIATVLHGPQSAWADDSGAHLERYYVRGSGAQKMNNAVGLESGHWGNFLKTVDLGSVGKFSGQEISIGGATGEPHFGHNAIFSVDPAAPGVRVDAESVSISLEGVGAKQLYDALIGLTAKGTPPSKNINDDKFKLNCSPVSCEIWLSMTYGDTL